MSESNNQEQTVSGIQLSENQDGGTQNGIPLVFFRESSLFGNYKPDYTQYIKHEEMYKAIGNIIDPSHISGLQRVNGMWRIYIDNLEDKATLIARGVTLRGKTLPIIQTNPMRPDYENTVRVRIQNIPLSVDDGIITRKFVILGLDVISLFREKLRINGKLTNCETGDRIVTVKTSSLQEPLARFIQFGQFKAKVIHRGQKKTFVKCTKCLETGHSMSHCPNDWKCLQCNEYGHKKGDCVFVNHPDTENPSEASEASDTDIAESCDNDDDTLSHEQHDKDRAGSHSPVHEHSSDKQEPETMADARREKDRASRSKKKKEKKSEKSGRNSKQASIGQFLRNASHEVGTPNRSRSKSLARSPPTPAEELCDNSKKPKKK